MPKAQRVIHIDTNELCVTEWRLGVGASTDHRRQFCDRIMVPLTRGWIRLASAEGENRVELLPGASFLRAGPLEQDAINDGDAPIAFVEIELKDTARRLISG